MMHYIRQVIRLGLILTPEQHLACAFLEAAGLRFGVDFGYANAVDKALGLQYLPPEVAEALAKVYTIH